MVLLRKASSLTEDLEEQISKLQLPTKMELYEEAANIILKSVEVVNQAESSYRCFKKKGKTRRSKGKVIEDTLDNKLPSMRTAADVIKRLQWDSSLNAENFVIGYVDRFVGILERPFLDFSWGIEALTGDDPSVFTVPQHRISFFKYNDEIVWDKEKRLDKIFGSTGDEVFRPKIESDSDSDSDDSSEYTSERQSRPNYFWCVRVVNNSLTEKIDSIQVCCRYTALLHNCLNMLFYSETIATLGRYTSIRFVNSTNGLSFNAVYFSIAVSNGKPKDFQIDGRNAGRKINWGCS